MMKQSIRFLREIFWAFSSCVGAGQYFLSILSSPETLFCHHTAVFCWATTRGRLKDEVEHPGLFHRSDLVAVPWCGPLSPYHSSIGTSVSDGVQMGQSPSVFRSDTSSDKSRQSLTNLNKSFWGF